MDEAIRKRCKDEIGKLLAFIETTSGKRLSMSMIVNMQTGEQSSPVKRLEDWLYQFYRAAYADGQRAGLEQARQQLSDAQATMARLESVIAKQQFSIEDLSKEHAKQANYRVQAEQQVARLRGVLTDIANTPHGNDHLHTLIAVENMAEQALRETGA